MVKMTHKICICLLLGLALGSLNAYSNNLTQLDIRKSSSSASTLNVTIYTSSPYDDNVAVTKKTDNKYVIIMPNVSGVTGSKPDLTGLHDVISGIDVKSVQDDGNGYTKVTLTTTKPINIRTTTKRSAPLTAEQKAYKNLIAQSRTNKPVTNSGTVKTSHASAVPSATIKFDNPKVSPHKSTSQLSSVNKALIASEPINAVPDKKKESTVNIAKSKVNDVIKSPLAEKPIVGDVNEDLEKHAPLSIAFDAPLPEESTDNVVQEPAKPAPVAVQTKPAAQNLLVQKVKLVKNKIENKINRRISANMFVTFVILMCSMIGLTLLFKLIKKSLEHSMILKQTFKENLLSKPVEVESYDDIVNDSELNWQEKYQKYIDNTKSQDTGRRILKHIGGGEYKFVNEVAGDETPSNSVDKKDIQMGFSEPVADVASSGSAQPKPKKANKLKSYNKTARDVSPENIPPIKKVKNQDLKVNKAPKLHIVEDDYKDLEESLERTLNNTPDKELLNIDEEIIFNQLKDNFKASPVFDEADKIADAMRSTKKLKSFANKMALEETKRNVPLPKTRSEIRRAGNIESKYVELGNSPLHTNPRKLEGANLSVGDLIAKSDKFLKPTFEVKPKISSNTNDKYSTVTLDEFFDKIDSSSSVTAPASLASRVADSLGKMTTEINAIQKVKSQAKPSVNPFEGMVVLSGYSINEDSGFYIVKDRDGNNSLIGRIKNDVTPIKKLGRDSDVKLQVRLDSPNVYMVRANGSRYLIEVNGNKMGILLEL